jgi:ABC-type glutathione transport system ATPase component
MSLLHVKDLSITFKSDEKETPAVQEVSFSVERGQIVGLIGESGSGKTAIADAIMGLQPKNAHLSGEIFFDERPLVNLSEKEMQ